MTGDNAKIREAQVARSPSKTRTKLGSAFSKLRLAPRKETKLVIDPSTMPLSSIVAAVSKNSTNAGTMAVVPLVLASAGITSYARYASSHTPAESKTSSHELEQEREEHLHQHVALAWKGTRRSSNVLSLVTFDCSGSLWRNICQSCATSSLRHAMLAPRKTLYSTPLRVFRRALELVHVTTGDVVYDLGCGDGRLLIEAARSFGVRAVGVEIDPKRAQQARDAAQANGVGHLVTVHEANALEFDIPADATVVFLFLIGRGLSLVRPKLEKLQACRVVTYLYRIPNLTPLEKHLVPVREPMSEQDLTMVQSCKTAVDPAEVVFPVYIYHFLG